MKSPDLTSPRNGLLANGLGAGLLKRGLLRQLAHLRHGQLTLVEAGERQLFGQPDAHLRAEIQVHDEAFWLFVHTVDDLWGTQKDIAWRPYPTNFVVFYDYWKMIGQQAPRDPVVPLVRR